jgi:hypothetical protein
MARAAPESLCANSLIGRLIVLLGLNLVSSEVGAYFLGFLIILGCIFLLGLVVETKLWRTTYADQPHPARFQRL